MPTTSIDPIPTPIYKREEAGWMDAAADDEACKEVSVAIDAAPEKPGWRVLHRVLPELQLRERYKMKRMYEPEMLSLGPYHHDRLAHSESDVEQLKEEARGVVCGATDKAFLLSKISERLDEIRHFYGGAAGHGDDELGEMMLRDACFVLWYITSGGGTEDYYVDFDRSIYRRLGMYRLVAVFGDALMVENQIPFWLVKMLFSMLNAGEAERDEKWRALMCRFLSSNKFWDNSIMRRLPWDDDDDDDDEPLHLLEALRRALIEEDERKTSKHPPPKPHRRRRGKRFESPLEGININSSFLSATALKAKGIRLGRSSQCLRDIRFRSLPFYGKLKLPVIHITETSFVLFANAVALEMSPETKTGYEVASYWCFMRELLKTEEDVEELRRKGILRSRTISESDEEEVPVLFQRFKDIGTYELMSDDDYFQGLKEDVQKHCSSSARTWLPDLLHTYF